MKQKTFCVFLVIAVLMSLLCVSAASISAQAPETCCPQPVYNLPVVVDGNIADWATVPVFANMYRASDPCKPVEAYLRLVYNCRTGIMYVLVLSKNGMPVQQDPSEAWVKVDWQSNPVVFTAFAWVVNSSGVTIGWEASFPLSEGTHFLKAHTNVNDGGWQTASTGWICILVDCPPTAVTLAGFSVTAGKGGIQINWETASEINNLGFNLYRGTSNDVESAVKINSALIPTTHPGSVAGGSYSYLDNSARAGVTYHYWLEDVEAAQTVVQLGLHDLSTGQWNKPVANYVSPASGGQVYSTPQKFTAVYRDRDGDLAIVYLLIADSADPNAGVQVRYDHRSGQFSLNNGTKALLKSGAAKVLEDGKLKITVVLTFKAGFRGSHNLYIRAQDAPGNKTVWRLAGTWTVQ